MSKVVAMVLVNYTEADDYGSILNCYMALVEDNIKLFKIANHHKQVYLSRDEVRVEARWLTPDHAIDLSLIHHHDEVEKVLENEYSRYDFEQKEYVGFTLYLLSEKPVLDAIYIRFPSEPDSNPIKFTSFLKDNEQDIKGFYYKEEGCCAVFCSTDETNLNMRILSDSRLTIGDFKEEVSRRNPLAHAIDLLEYDQFTAVRVWK